jgi:hypothetical protein
MDTHPQTPAHVTHAREYKMPLPSLHNAELPSSPTILILNYKNIVPTSFDNPFHKHQDRGRLVWRPRRPKACPQIFTLSEHTGLANDLSGKEGAQVCRAGVWLSGLFLG